MVRILYFGRLSDVTGVAQEDLTLPEGLTTTGELRAWLDTRFAATGAMMEPSVRVALDSEFVFDRAPITAAREIAFMPPVGGG